MVTEEGDVDDDLDEVVEPVAAQVITLAVRAGDKYERLDVAITAQVAQLSRAQTQRLIEDGHVTLNGARGIKAGAKLRTGDTIVVSIPPPTVLEVLPEAIPLDVLFEDADVIVVNKPAGLVVHPAPGHPSGTLVNALLHHCTDLSGIGGVLRPGIVHRLDKDTTGVMVATKTDRAHTALVAQFQARTLGIKGGIDRAYVAIASPPPPSARGTLRTLYDRHPKDRKKFSSRVERGRTAVTHWEVLERMHASALVQCVLETGRTHQIRVHAADHGWPLVGDPRYGVRSRDARVAAVGDALARQALHARHLGFIHPGTGNRVSFDAPIPEDFAAALAALRG